MCFRRPSSRSTPAWLKWLATVVAVAVAVSAVVVTEDEVAVAAAAVTVVEAAEVSKKHQNYSRSAVEL